MPDSVELKTIKKCTSALETALREIDRDLVHFLNDEGFIRDEAHDTILNSSSRSEASKAGELVTRIKTTVDLDPAKYHTLISWFKKKGASYQPIVNILEAEYRRQSGSLPAQEMLPHGARGVPSGVQYPQGPHQAGPYQLAGQGAGQFGQYNQTQQQGPPPNPTPVQYQPPSLYSGTQGNLQGYVSGAYQQQHAATWNPSMQQPGPAYHPAPPQGPSPRGYGPGEQQNAASWNPAMQQPGPPYHPIPPQGPSPRGYWPGEQQNAATWNPSMQQPGPAYHPPPHHPGPDVPNGRATNGVSNGSGPGIGAPQNLSKTSYEYYVSCIPVQHRSKLDREVDFENGGIDLHLGEIADVLQDWEDVAPALGLSGIEISDIQESQHRPSLRRKAALRKWKSSQFGSQSTYGSLLRIFTTNRRFKCAEKIVELLRGNGQPISTHMNQPPQGYQPTPPQQQGHDMRYQQPSFHPSSSQPGNGNPTQAPPPSTYSGSGGNAYGYPAEYTDGGGGASLPPGRQADYPGDRSRGAPVKRKRLDHSAEFTLLNITQALKIVPPKNYMILGLSMGVEESTVRTFEQDCHRDSDRVRLEITSLWLRNITQPKPSWQELENVLDRIL